jgi:hypothetical protein
VKVVAGPVLLENGNFGPELPFILVRESHSTFSKAVIRISTGILVVNGSNADKAPKSNAMIVQLATHLTRGLCAISGSWLSTIFDYRARRISAAMY